MRPAKAFDKVARLLGLGYPGGPLIQRTARKVTRRVFHLLPAPGWRGTLGFSFSGIKTRGLEGSEGLLNPRGRSMPVADMAASFQAAVVDVLFNKTIRAAREFGVKEISGCRAAFRPIAPCAKRSESKLSITFIFRRFALHR